jgi:hypothetical protein
MVFVITSPKGEVTSKYALMWFVWMEIVSLCKERRARNDKYNAKNVELAMTSTMQMAQSSQ